MALYEMYKCSFCKKTHKIVKKSLVAPSITCTSCSHRMDLINEPVVEVKEAVTESIKPVAKELTHAELKELRLKKTEELRLKKLDEEARIKAEQDAYNAVTSTPNKSVGESTIEMNIKNIE